jgi:hypothetical protein
MHHSITHSFRGRAARVLVLLLILLSPVALAGVAWIPNSLMDRVRHGDSCIVSQQCFQSIERSIRRDPQWTVLGRSFHPSQSNWSLVMWHDSHLHPDQVDPDELLVLEYLAVSQALVATMRVSDAPPASSFAPKVSEGRAFIRGLRGDLTFRSRFIGRADQVELFDLVDQLLNRRVREIHQPRVSLTSAFH